MGQGRPVEVSNNRPLRHSGSYGTWRGIVRAPFRTCAVGMLKNTAVLYPKIQEYLLSIHDVAFMKRTMLVPLTSCGWDIIFRLQYVYGTRKKTKQKKPIVCAVQGCGDGRKRYTCTIVQRFSVEFDRNTIHAR